MKLGVECLLCRAYRRFSKIQIPGKELKKIRLIDNLHSHVAIACQDRTGLAFKSKRGVYESQPATYRDALDIEETMAGWSNSTNFRHRNSGVLVPGTFSAHNLCALLLTHRELHKNPHVRGQVDAGMRKLVSQGSRRPNKLRNSPCPLGRSLLDPNYCFFHSLQPHQRGKWRSTKARMFLPAESRLGLKMLPETDSVIRTRLPTKARMLNIISVHRLTACSLSTHSAAGATCRGAHSFYSALARDAVPLGGSSSSRFCACLGRRATLFVLISSSLLGKPCTSATARRAFAPFPLNLSLLMFA